MISILISTIDARIEGVKNVLLPNRDDIQYIVSHQYTEQKFRVIPSELLRSDVTVSQIEGKGLTKSRNNAMRLATGDIALFADDDVTYKADYIDVIKQTFRENPELDIALFKIKTWSGEPEYKNYPTRQIEWNKYLFPVSSIEIAYRIDRLKRTGVVFDERFGAGQKLLINSEEVIFIQDCINIGLHVLFVPEYIVEHPYESTIKAIPKYDKRINWITGAYDCRTNGKIAMAKAFLGTIKILPDLLKHRTNPLVYLYHRLSAVIYILRTNRKVKDSSAG